MYAEAIWFRKLTGDNLLAMESHGLFSSGGGAGWVDITGQQALLDFFQATIGATRPSFTISAERIGSPGTSGVLRFEPRTSNRYRILNQGRFRHGSERHPAWDPNIDPTFPSAPSITTVAQANAVLQGLGGVHLYIVRASDGEYYAGFTTGSTRPTGWPSFTNRLFANERTGHMTFAAPPSGSTAVTPLVLKILDAWKRRHNVLLYGPPGTGKTYAMSQLRTIVENATAGSPSGPPVVYFNPSNQANPWQQANISLPFPVPVALDWVTFHQNYAYEDFIVGLRPDTSATTLKLKPRLGRMLELAVRIWQTGAGQVESAVMFIDELNRGNVSRIFGEFITFMDGDYRHTDTAGALNPQRLPVPLAQVNVSAGQSEQIDRPGGGSVQLPWPFYWPQHVYVVASMNSVDRAVAPLDTALSRRFERIEVRADLDGVQQALGVNANQVLSDVKSFTDARAAGSGTLPSLPSLSAGDTAWLLLRRLNDYIATSLGIDFELGHTYVLGVQNWTDLARVWDHALWPQLQERFASRPQHLQDLLKATEPDRPNNYLIGTRQLLPSMSPVERDAVTVPNLSEAVIGSVTAVQETLVFLALP